MVIYKYENKKTEMKIIYNLKLYQKLKMFINLGEKTIIKE